MSNNDNKLISLEHLGIVKQYIDTKCGDLSNDLYTTSHNVDKNTQDIASIRNEIADLNLGGGGAMSSIDWLQFQVKRLEDAGADANSDFNGLGIGKRFISLESGIDGLDARISSLENQSSTDAGVTENANINADTLINMINSDNVTNSVLTVNSKFGSGIIKFISDNGTINASKIVGSLPASMLNGTISASMLSGTINEDTIPSIPFSKIQSDTVGIKLNATKTIESNNGLWILSGDGSGKISESFKWDSLGNFTIGDNLISWSQLTNETIPDEIIEKIKAQIGGNTGSTDSLDMQNLQNNYFGNLIGYRIKNGQNIINDKEKNVKTTVSELLGDKIGVFEYTADNKVKTTTDANGNVIPVVTTVSSVIGNVTGAKAKYNEYNKMTGVEYDKDISVAAKFEEIEKNWIGKSFKPTFEAKTINDDSFVSQTSKSVADVFDEIKIDWIGESLTPVYAETNGVKTRKSQNIEDILNELKTKWLGEVIDETNGNNVKLGVVHNADGTITNNQSAAELFNEIQVDWIGRGFKPGYSGGVRNTDTVFESITDIKTNLLGSSISADKSVTSHLLSLSDLISVNTSNITNNKSVFDTFVSEYKNWSGQVDGRFVAMEANIQKMDQNITNNIKAALGQVTTDNLTGLVEQAINDGKLNLVTHADLEGYATDQDLLNHASLADATYETKTNVDNKLTDYLKTTDIPTLNVMIGSIANVDSQTWGLAIKNATLNECDNRYATVNTAEALSNYLRISEIKPSIGTASNKIQISVGGIKSETIEVPYAVTAGKATNDGNNANIANTYAKTASLTNGTITVKKAEKATRDGSDNVITSTYATITAYNQLVDKYETLQKEYKDLVDLYDDLANRVRALESN
jgi:hypothetical protein